MWLPLSLFALVVWTVQRLLSKLALNDLGTGKFYLLSAVVSLLTYTPYLLLRPPTKVELLPAFGLACLMSVTFGVTTEAIRRGPLGAVSPITALSPTLTAVLAISVLHERVGDSCVCRGRRCSHRNRAPELGSTEGEGQPTADERCGPGRRRALPGSSWQLASTRPVETGCRNHRVCLRLSGHSHSRVSGSSSLWAGFCCRSFGRHQSSPRRARRHPLP